jgi:hypothetical protein
VVCGPDARPILDRIEEYAKVGFTHVSTCTNSTPDQEGFLRFAEREILTEFAPVGARR